KHVLVDGERMPCWLSSAGTTERGTRRSKGEPSSKGFIRPGTAGKSGAGRPQGPQAKQQPEAALAGVVRCEVPAAREKEPLLLFRVRDREGAEQSVRNRANGPSGERSPEEARPAGQRPN